MSRIWRWVAILTAILLILSAALVGSKLKKQL